MLKQAARSLARTCQQNIMRNIPQETVSVLLTIFILETTISLMAEDLETRLITNRPCSEREFLTVDRNDSSTKSEAGQVIPELHERNKI